ncbi:hypothetical protein E4U41_003555, partial [Claviceps citrina]
MADQVPTFSLRDLLAAQSDGAPLTALLDCLTTKGIFYLTDTGLSDADHAAARETCLSFFRHASDEAKRAVTLPDRNARRGFSGLGWESTAVITETGSFSDYSTCYSMGRAGNLFPDREFGAVWQAYFDKMYDASRAVARVVLEAAAAADGEHGKDKDKDPGLDLDPDLDLDDFLDCDPLLRLRCFPDVPDERVAEQEPLRMGAHYDLSTITLVHQTACANGFVSLQCDLAGRFVDLPTRPDTMVVFCGAVATLVSGGRIRAPLHRVTSPARDQRHGSSRTSSVFFLRPKPSFRFSVPQAVGWGFNVRSPAETTTFGDWLGGNY